MGNLRIICKPCCDEETLVANRAANAGVPELSGSGALAVVGGGQSAFDCLEELRGWGGEIWAINQTASFLRENGVDCWFYTVDPSDLIEPMVSGRAVMADHCDPAAFANADEAWMLPEPIHGPTSAVSSAYTAIRAGFRSVTFYGCEGSYGETTHVYRDEPVADLVRVRCDGADYLTKLELIVQSELLATIVRRAPDVYSVRGGGLLRAMVNDLDYQITHVSPRLVNNFVRIGEGNATNL